jgi:hypothetical protein
MPHLRYLAVRLTVVASLALAAVPAAVFHRGWKWG